MSAELASRTRLPRSKDTRLLIAGVGAFLALVAYLAVAFARTHIVSTTSLANPFGPWSPVASKLTRVPHGSRGGFAVRVAPVSGGPATGKSYGAVVQTLVPDPARGGRYTISLWLQGSRPGRIAFEVNEFRPGVARYPVQTTVPATARWHHFTFSLRVKGVWLGLAVYAYRVETGRPTWFAVRDLTAALRGR